MLCLPAAASWTNQSYVGGFKRGDVVFLCQRLRNKVKSTVDETDTLTDCSVGLSTVSRKLRFEYQPETSSQNTEPEQNQSVQCD